MANLYKNVGELLEENHRYAAVLHQHGIDFFDHLDQTLAEACRSNQVSLQKVHDHLTRVDLQVESLEKDFRHYSPGRLATHLQKSHHNYAQVMLPIIQHHIERTAAKHNREYPHLHLINNVFEAFCRDFLEHIHYENRVVFPYIKKLERHAVFFRHTFLLDVKDFSLDQFILKHAHDDDDMLLLRKLTHQYRTDADDHIAYKILMRELRDFEADLHQHSLIEEKILIPKVQVLEKNLHRRLGEAVKAN